MNIFDQINRKNNVNEINHNQRDNRFLKLSYHNNTYINNNNKNTINIYKINQNY